MLFLQVCKQSCSKKMRERVFLQSNLSQNPMKTREQCLRGSEWMRVECEGSTPTSRPLFKERMAGHRWEELGTTASSRWKKLAKDRCQVGSADPGVWPAPLWAHWPTARAHGFPNSYKFWNFGCPAKLCFERCSKLFFKEFSCSEIILDFCEKQKKC